MLIERAKQLLRYWDEQGEAIRAFARGETVQFFSTNHDEWRSTDDPDFLSGVKYRVKPEAMYRPFTDTEAQLVVCRRVRSKNAGVPYSVTRFNGQFHLYQNLPVTVEDLLQHYEFLNDDGSTSPCGVLVE